MFIHYIKVVLEFPELLAHLFLLSVIVASVFCHNNRATLFMIIFVGHSYSHEEQGHTYFPISYTLMLIFSLLSAEIYYHEILV